MLLDLPTHFKFECLVFFLIFKKNFYLFILRERESRGRTEGKGERERERDRETDGDTERGSQAGFMFSVEPNTGLDLVNCEIMT